MKKGAVATLITAVILLGLIVSAITFSQRSTLWQQDFFVENSTRLKALNEGWGVKEDAPNTNGELTMRRMVYADEVNEMAMRSRSGIQLELYGTGSAYRPSPALFFITHNQSVRVYADDGTTETLIYSFGHNGTRFLGTESGSAIHAVRLPVIYGEKIMITVQLTPSFSSGSLKFDQWYHDLFPPHLPKFFMGWSSQILQQVWSFSWFQWVPALVLVIMALAEILYYASYLVMYRKKLTRHLFLGVFSLLVGMCLFFDSYLGMYFCRNSFTVYLASTLLMAFHPFSVVLFMQFRRSFAHSDTISRTLKAVSLVNVVLVCLLSVIPAIPFSLVRAYVCIVLMITCVLSLMVIIHEVFAEKTHADFYDILAILVSASLLLDFAILLAHPSAPEAFRISRWALVLFFATLGNQASREFFGGEIAHAKGETLHKATTTDIVTGCRNGASLWFEERIIHPRVNYGFMLLMVPGFLNVLQTRGEKESDGILRIVSQSLLHSLAPGSVYRMNGSKFGIYFDPNEVHLLEKVISDLSGEIEAFNATNNEYKISLLSVQGQFDPNFDHDFDGFYSRLLSELRKKYYEVVKTSGWQLNLF